VKVHADAGIHELSVVVKTPTKTIKKKVKAVKTLDFKVAVHKGYSVSGYHGGFLVDRETALKKTGLQIK
jgi:type 1 glutamine amidotransferase